MADCPVRQTEPGRSRTPPTGRPPAHQAGGEGTAPMESLVVWLPRTRLTKLHERANDLHMRVEQLAAEIIDVWLSE